MAVTFKGAQTQSLEIPPIIFKGAQTTAIFILGYAQIIRKK